jgi:phage terminase large subunit-like protein
LGQPLLARAISAAGGWEPFLREVGLDAAQLALKTWGCIARPEQLPPAGDWNTWLILAGRGFGKTRTGAEWTKQEIEAGRCRRFALVAPTASDARDIMIEGHSGIMSLYQGHPADERPIYEPSKRRITWPSGAMATAYSAEEPDRLRGPQHDGFWADEIAAWQKDRVEPTWDNLQFGLRLGQKPRGVVTTTPRPIAIIRALVADATTRVTRGSTFDNSANLAGSFLTQIRKKYEGTRLGRQEIYAEILDDNPGALWRMSQIDMLRLLRAPELRRIVVAIDPAVTSNEESDETGIVVAGRARCSCNGRGEDHLFVIEDASGILAPDAWARASVAAYHKHQADRVIGEVNNGGDLIESNIRTLGDRQVSYREVRASRGKAIRAEPIASLYEQGKAHHIGFFSKLEDEMTQWNPLTGERSPSRMDALVWAATDLMLGPENPTFVGPRVVVPRRN